MYYKVRFEDGDEEEYTEAEVASVIVGASLQLTSTVTVAPNVNRGQSVMHKLKKAKVSQALDTLEPVIEERMDTNRVREGGEPCVNPVSHARETTNVSDKGLVGRQVRKVNWDTTGSKN